MVDRLTIDPLNAEGSGASSGQTIRVSADATPNVAGVRLFKSYPTLALSSSLPSTGVADGRLMRFTVTANAAGPVGLSELDFTIATSSFVAGGGVTHAAAKDSE